MGFFGTAQLVVHRQWGPGKFTCTSVWFWKKPAFFCRPQNWWVSNQFSTSTMSSSSDRNKNEKIRKKMSETVTEIIRREREWGGEKMKVTEEEWEWRLHRLQWPNWITQGPFASVLMPAMPFPALWPFWAGKKTSQLTPRFWQPFNMPPGQQVFQQIQSVACQPSVNSEDSPAM